MKQVLFSVTKKDLVIEFYSGHGPGGQNRNKCQNCVRIKHPESGAVATGQEERDRKQNIKNALHRLAEHPKFKIWVNRKVWEIDHHTTIEEEVEKRMAPQFLKFEMQKEGVWVPYSD